MAKQKKEIPQDVTGLLHSGRGLARWLKKVDIPLDDLRVGDVICDGVSDPYFVARKVEEGSGYGIYDIYDNGGIVPKKGMVRIVRSTAGDALARFS